MYSQFYQGILWSLVYLTKNINWVPKIGKLRKKLPHIFHFGLLRAMNVSIVPITKLVPCYDFLGVFPLQSFPSCLNQAFSIEFTKNV